MKATIDLMLSTSDECQRVLDAVSPDNHPLPQGLSITSRLQDAHLIFEIASKKGIDTLRATLEDLLSAIDLAMRTSEIVE